MKNAARAVVYVTDVVQGADDGHATFTLHVENAPFVGYANGLMTNLSLNNRQKSASMTMGMGNILSPRILGDAEIGTEHRVNKPVTIEVGIYPGCIITITTAASVREYVAADSGIALGTTTVYEDSIPETFVSARLDLRVEPI